MSTVNLHDEIERFRERLLDLSLRNPLLSYRKSKRRTLQVVNELPDEMYERLMEAGKPFIFDFAPDPPKQRNESVDRAAVSFLGDVEADPGKIRAAGMVGAVAVKKDSDGETKKYPILLPEVPSERLGRSNTLFDDRLQTNLTQDRLNATLRYMQREALTAVQETGINYLFLAIGFLAWKEAVWAGL